MPNPRNKQQPARRKNRKRDISISGKGSAKIIGLGSGGGEFAVDYRRNVPLAASRKKIARQPRVNGSRAFTVSHSEFLADLTAVDPGFEVTSYSINPAQSATFPWLSSLARNFDQYRIKSLLVRFESAAPATENGRVFMAFDYDPQDPVPASKGEFMSYRGATSDAVWTSGSVSFNGPRLGKAFYTRAGQVVGDVRLFDAANLLVSTSGVANGLLCGELYIDYTMELVNPQGSSACAAETYAAALFSSALPGGISAVLAFCTSSNPAFAEILNQSDFAIHTIGNYVVTIYNDVATGSPTTSTALGLTVLSGSGSAGLLTYGFTSNAQSQSFLLDVTVPGAIFRFSGPVGSITSTNQIYITPAPG